MLLMIDGMLPPKRRFDNLPPKDREHLSNIVVGDHSKDDFRPPQQVAAQDQAGPAPVVPGTPTRPHQLPPQNTSPHPQSKPPRRSLREWLRGLSKKQKIILTVVAALLVAGSIIGAYFAFFASEEQRPAAVIQKKEEPKPTTVASSLSGLQVDPDINERPVTAVMIENSVVSRPQSGLLQASVVFEAIAEGGITRFVALYQDTEPDYVGPVRSARPYYMTWALGFDAAYAHAGGSADALSLINQWGVKDLPHHNSYFWRIGERSAPHNLYTSIPKLREYEASKGFGKANFTPLPRKEKETPAATPTAQTINLNISSANFNVQYAYDAASNSYKRVLGGTPHTDEKSGTQITPKVVVALIVPQGKDGIYSTYQTVGSGQVMVFQDGEVKTGTWKKDSNNQNFTFTDASGATLQLNPGQTWFTVLGDAGQVTYTP